MIRHWDFYGRRDEVGRLLETMRKGRWFFGAVRGRRRIGKTALVQQALTILRQDEPRRRPVVLVQLPDGGAGDFAAVFRSTVREAALEGILDGLDEVRDLPAVANAIGALCNVGAVVALDEFQVCHSGPLSVFPSLLQAQVDRLQDREEGGGLIVLGSVQTEMEALLNDRRAPLYGRTTFNLALGPWDFRTVFEVSDRHGAADPRRCLTAWTLFGGVPKYWRHFAEAGSLDALPDWGEWAAELCRRLFLRSDAPLREEGESLLGLELRRNYLAVLRVLAERSRSHAELREALPDLRSLGPYLQTLTRDLRLVERELPVFAQETGKGARYHLSDPFLRAWLSVLQPACQAARVLPPSEVAQRLVSRLAGLEGWAFERMVRQASEDASRAGDGDFPLTDLVRGYWNRPRTHSGSIEIDLVAWNEDHRRVRFGSCKRDPRRHDRTSLGDFYDHVQRFLSTRRGKRFQGWRRELALFAPLFPADQRSRLTEDGWVCRDLTDFRRTLSDDARGVNGDWTVADQIAGEYR